MGFYLDTEEVLGRVAAGQGPFGLLAGQQRVRHGHLAARDVGAELLAQPPERQVAHRRQRRQVQFALPVDLQRHGHQHRRAMTSSDRVSESILCRHEKSMEQN